MTDCSADLREFAWSYLWRLSHVVPAKFTIEHLDPVNVVAFSPTAGTLATASGNTIRLWDASTCSFQATLEGHTDIVQALAFSPDGTMLVSGGADRPAVLWDVATRQEIATLTLTEQMGTVWNVSLAFSGSGETVAVTFNTSVVLWDVNTGESVSLSQEGEDDKKIFDVAFSPDDKLLAATGAQKTTLWEIATRQRAILRGHWAYVKSVVFFPDGLVLATTGNDGTLRFWDVTTGEQLDIINPHSAPVLSMALSPDGAILAIGSADTTIRLWNLGMEHEIVILTGHTSNVYSLAFSPDGRTLASGGDDGTVRLWNLVLHEQVAVLEGHGSAIWDVAFSPDGHTLASSSFDSTIKLWRAATEHEIHTQSAPIN